MVATPRYAKRARSNAARGVAVIVMSDTAVSHIQIEKVRMKNDRVTALARSRASTVAPRISVAAATRSIGSAAAVGWSSRESVMRVVRSASKSRT